MSYISQSENNSPWNHAFTDIKKTNLSILIVGIKEPTTVQQVLEDISSQKLTGKCNRVHVITNRRYEDTIKKISKKIDAYSIKSDTYRPLGEIISLYTKHPTPDHIGDVVNIPLISE